jgi:2-polyprenyl-3-methyl-5-hydroxy-6-metoxy-1,4-benzoquinol methylase
MSHHATTMSCNCCDVASRTFDLKTADDDLRHYRRSGPARQTLEVLRAVRQLVPAGATLLDVGGGIGVIHHELLDGPVAEATQVDASDAYLQVARQESARRGHASRVGFVHADFTTVAAELPKADVVTLDRVVCCYPDFRSLLQAAAGRCKRILAITYPRETWYMRIALSLINLMERLRGETFRSYLHPADQMVDLLDQLGLHQVAARRFFVWQVSVFSRS